jgi:hypothetical protein
VLLVFGFLFINIFCSLILSLLSHHLLDLLAATAGSSIKKLKRLNENPDMSLRLCERKGGFARASTLCALFNFLVP